MRVQLLQLLGELRPWVSAGLMIFPAHRRLRKVEADYARLRRREILRAVEPSVVVENRRLRTTVEAAAVMLATALDERSTQDAPESLRLVR